MRAGTRMRARGPSPPSTPRPGRKVQFPLPDGEDSRHMADTAVAVRYRATRCVHVGAQQSAHPSSRSSSARVWSSWPRCGERSIPSTGRHTMSASHGSGAPWRPSVRKAHAASWVAAPWSSGTTSSRSRSTVRRPRRPSSPRSPRRIRRSSEPGSWAAATASSRAGFRPARSRPRPAVTRQRPIGCGAQHPASGPNGSGPSGSSSPTIRPAPATAWSTCSARGRRDRLRPGPRPRCRTLPARSPRRVRSCSKRPTTSPRRRRCSATTHSARRRRDARSCSCRPSSCARSPTSSTRWIGSS